MVTITLKIPDSLLISTGGSIENITRESQYFLAVKLFELGRLSAGQAAEMCEMNRVDFILRLGKSGTPVVDLDKDELDQEIQNV